MAVFSPCLLFLLTITLCSITQARPEGSDSSVGKTEPSDRTKDVANKEVPITCGQGDKIKEIPTLRKKRSPADDDDDTDKPRKKRKTDEDDDETPKKKKKKTEDDDDDETPKKKKKKTDDDEDEETPKKKKKKADDDDDEEAKRKAKAKAAAPKGDAPDKESGADKLKESLTNTVVAPLTG